MRKSNKRSGLTLIEALCSISILSIMVISIITVQMNNYKLREYNRELEKYLPVLEAVKAQIINNETFDSILEIYTSNKTVISNEKLTLDSVRTLDARQLFNQSPQNQKTYIQLNILAGEVLKIELDLNIILNNRHETIKCEFYKGNYI